MDCIWNDNNTICINCKIPNPLPNKKINRNCLINYTKQKYPSTITRSVNFAKALARFVYDPRFVKKEVFEARLKICDECPFKTAFQTCGKCGCSLKGKILNKAKLVTELCPDNRWPK